MKKSFLKTLTRVLVVASACTFLFSCENFIEGGDFKNALEADIAYAKSPSFNIEVSLSNPNHGSISSTGNQYVKLNSTFEIEFRMNN